MSAPHSLILVRHGESTWNLENKFAGWYDADLAESGVEEAKFSGDVSSVKWNCGIITLLAITTLCTHQKLYQHFLMQMA